ncbi:MAG: LTA synthase family protein, partial [Parabacteroides sp.]|nr:LTA synthase family protein [Parabacteroides sp.]
IGFLFSGIVCLAYSFTNYWKIVSRDDPLFAEDLTLVKEAMQMSEEYVNITFKIYMAVAFVIIGTILIALFIKGRSSKVVWRIVASILVVFLSGELYSGAYTSSEVYYSFPVWEKLNPWFESSNYISRGGIYPFIYSIQTAMPYVPEGYDENESEQLLKQYKYDLIPEDKQVNVMVVMFEAYSDLSKYTDMITLADPYEDFHRLQEESYTGELVTNVFAGGTIDTERSVITGFSNLSSFRRDSWSYVRYFSDMGYSIDGSHAGYKSFYNRYNINKNLGFGEYKFIENYYSQIQPGIPMDDVFLPEITRLFSEQINSSKKAFSFSVTYQNHGPYEDFPREGQFQYVPQGDLDVKDHSIINNYLRGIENTSYHMMNIADQFRDSKEPVVLVFFGDHKPWLGEFSSTYTALGINIFEDSEESFYNHYNTEYLIWANDAAKEILGNDFVGEGPTISPCYLMNVLFEQCGWEGPEYLKFSNEVMEVFPVTTTTNKVLINDTLIDTGALADKTLLNEFRKMQYYLSRDYYN